MSPYTPVMLAVNCHPFDALLNLSDYDVNLFFCTGHCFICRVSTHRSERCLVHGSHILFHKCLDNPHHT
jgi:hypothetical protein